MGRVMTPPTNRHLAQPTAPFHAYRHTRERMVPDQAGEWVALHDARRTLNGMESELTSLRAGAGGEGPWQDRLVQSAHRLRGDNLRLWSILGEGVPKAVDIFQRAADLVSLVTRQDAEIRQLRVELAAWKAQWPEGRPAPAGELEPQASLTAGLPALERPGGR